MSLFLRKACQENLDNVGLENYHIQVDESTKCLQIVGECGQILTSITGIRLSRMAPAPHEIKLAVELFDDFLAKHTATFKEFVAVKAKADNAVIPQTVALDKAQVTKQHYNDLWELRFRMTNRDHTVTVTSNGLISMTSVAQNISEVPATYFTLGLTKTEYAVVKKWLEATADFHKWTKRKKKLLEILGTCEI